MFTFLAHRIRYDGYGYSAIKIGQALARLEDEVRLVDMAQNGRFSTPGERRWTVEGRALAMCLPVWWPHIQTTGGLVGYTMFESTLLPDDLVEPANKSAEVCVVPTPFCAEVFRRHVESPVVMVPLGVDTGDYPLMQRRREGRRPYVFLWSGAPGFRKGWDLVYKAFWAAFGHRNDVRLAMHFRQMPRGVQGWSDENVTIVEGQIPHAEWLGLLCWADCFVFPSRGEGFGLPPREAAATGLPVIATNWSGLGFEIEHWALPLRVAEMRPASFGPWDDVGEWAEPDVDHLVELMRWCVEHREEAGSFGRRAAAWIATHATWERTARGLVRVMNGEAMDEASVFGAGG